MDTALGLFLLIVFAACVIVFAAAMTWVVVKLSPPKRRSERST